MGKKEKGRLSPTEKNLKYQYDRQDDLGKEIWRNILASFLENGKILLMELVQAVKDKRDEMKP